MKVLILFIFFASALLQEPFDVTDELANMTEGWSLGNGCDSETSNYIVNGNVHLNGFNLEANNSKITITGNVYLGGGQLIEKECEYSDIIVEGEIIQ